MVPVHAAAPGCDAAGTPCPCRCERPVEERDEVQRVAGARAAELPAGDLALHLVVAHDMDARRCDRVAAVRHLEEHDWTAVPAGKVKLEMPDRVVTASETGMDACPSPPSVT